MPAGDAHDPGSAISPVQAVVVLDLDEVARLLRHADHVVGTSELIDGLARQLRLATADPPSTDELERSDMQRLLALHRDQLTAWQALMRELAHRFDSTSRATKGWLEGNAAHIRTLEVVTNASTALTTSIAKLQAVIDKAYGPASEEELDRMFFAEAVRVAAKIPENVWATMVARRQGQ